MRVPLLSASLAGVFSPRLLRPVSLPKVAPRIAPLGTPLPPAKAAAPLQVREAGGAGGAAWDEEREQARIESWAQEQRERAERAERRNRKSRRGQARRRWGMIGAFALGWGVLNAPVRSLGGSDDTLGHALGRVARTRSLFPLREFAWRLTSRTSWAGAWAGGAQVLKASDLQGVSALECDVAVVGATPSGVAAALAAARRGAQVIVVEKRAHAGGDVVYAMLNMFDVMARPGETARVHGLFAEFFEQLGVSCDIDRARDLFDSALRAEPNVRFIPNVEVSSVYKDGDKVAGIHIKQGTSGRAIACKVLVDATNDADVAVMAGAGYYIGREDSNPDKKMQSAGLLFSVKNVNWSRVRDYVSGKRIISAGQRVNRRHAIDITPVLSPAQKLALTRKKLSGKIKAASQARWIEPGLRELLPPHGVLSQASKVWLRAGGGMGNYAWERGDIVRGYKALGRNIMALSINFGRQSDGSVVLNTINIINVDGLDAASRKKGRDEAIRELPNFLKYLRGRMPGFEKATLGRIAPDLYIRETRHIHGHYSLKVADIRRREKFFDRIAHAAYPLDLHPYSKTDINPFGPQRYFYTLPLRTLIPRGVDNVFVASRSLSATYSAAGSARVIPVTMAAGEAAGVAAWQCSRTGRTPHELVKDYPLTRAVQDSLRKGGADLGD